jgi:hypothetical protein
METLSEEKERRKIYAEIQSGFKRWQEAGSIVNDHLLFRDHHPHLSHGYRQG